MNSVNLKSPKEDLIYRGNSQTDNLSNMLRKVKCEVSDSFSSESSEFVGPHPLTEEKKTSQPKSPELVDKKKLEMQLFRKRSKTMLNKTLKNRKKKQAVDTKSAKSRKSVTFRPQCKHCHKLVDLELQKKISQKQIIICILLILSTGGLLAFLPFVISSCYDYRNFCPKCGGTTPIY